MRQFEFVSADGQPYTVRLPDPHPGYPSVYLFSHHKSGSTLMDGMVSTYSQGLGIPAFSLYNAAFDAGIPTNAIRADAAVCFEPEGYVYTGFRHYPHFTLPLAGHRLVWLVRDPRDMLVSLYYSVTRSHAVPKSHRVFREKREQAQSLSLEEFVLRNANTYLRSFARYRDQLPVEHLKVYRYEDVIYEKERWLRELVEFLGLPLKRRLVRTVAKRYDVFPEREEPGAHVRQVHPGNYLSKLTEAVCEELTGKLAPILDHHGYERHPAARAG